MIATLKDVANTTRPKMGLNDIFASGTWVWEKRGKQTLRCGHIYQRTAHLKKHRNIGIMCIGIMCIGALNQSILHSIV